MKKLIIAFLFLTMTFASHAFDRQDFIKSCIETYKDGTKSYQIARENFDLYGEKADVVAYLIQSIVTNKIFLNFTYNKLVQEGFNLDHIKDKNKLENIVTKACFSSIYSFINKGMVRLSAEEMRFSLEYGLNSLKLLKEKKEYGLCVMQGLGNGKSVNELTRLSKMIYREINVSQLRKNTDLLIKAFNSEIMDFPRKKRLTTEEIINAENIYKDLLIKRLQRMSKGDIERMVYALKDLEAANAQDSCDAIILTMEAALDAKGATGNNILIYIFSQYNQN